MLKLYIDAHFLTLSSIYSKRVIGQRGCVTSDLLFEEERGGAEAHHAEGDADDDADKDRQRQTCSTLTDA